MAEALLLVAESMTNGDMYAASRFAASDPFVWIELEGRRIAVVTGFDVELARRQSPADEVWSFEEVTTVERAAGASRRDVELARVVNAVRRAGATSVRVPGWFPIEEAERLRGAGVAVRVDAADLKARRRVKSPDENAALREIQAITEEGMVVIRDALRAADVAADGILQLDGAPLTSERLHARVQRHWLERGAEPTLPIVAGGAQGSDPHEHGHGPLRAHEPIVCDLFPRHATSRLFGDMTRTFSVGEPSPEVVAAHEACEAEIVAAIAAARAGVSGHELNVLVADVFRDRGYPSQVHPDVPGTWIFNHGLGHGVGYEIHESPNAGTSPSPPIDAGANLTIEPGLYRAGIGGCRIEDLVIFTADGCENLNRMDYALVVR